MYFKKYGVQKELMDVQGECVHQKFLTYNRASTKNKAHYRNWAAFDREHKIFASYK